MLPYTQLEKIDPKGSNLLPPPPAPAVPECTSDTGPKTISMGAALLFSFFFLCFFLNCSTSQHLDTRLHRSFWKRNYTWQSVHRRGANVYVCTVVSQQWWCQCAEAQVFLTHKKVSAEQKQRDWVFNLLFWGSALNYATFHSAIMVGVTWLKVRMDAEGSREHKVHGWYLSWCFLKQNLVSAGLAHRWRLNSA